MSQILSQKIKVALIQLNGSSPNKLDNLNRAAKFIEMAMQKQPDTKIVVLPECFNSPYSVTKFREYAEVIDNKAKSQSIDFLSKIALKYGIILVGGSIPEIDPQTNKIYNTSPIFNSKGDLIDIHRKVHLFDVDIPNGITFKESETLSPGNKLTTVNTPYGNVGIGICYDMRFPELTTISARKPNNAFAMVFPSAFNTVTGPMHWHLLARSRAVDNQIYTILCSPARNLESSYHAYGHSLICNPKGEIIAEASEGEEIIYAELDPEDIANFRQAIPLSSQRRFDLYKDISK
ncbi:putative hydrolase PWA37_004862 [Arxiozyma heterogenica]|uniref:putative hydrolase n=1 Tax=Arxiozyma heterogenica TaxID=278026 RepID=UPI002EE77EF7